MARPGERTRAVLNLLAGTALVSAILPAYAQAIEVTMRVVSATGIGEPIGTVTIAPSTAGVTFTPKLEGLAPGLHGFHVHDKPNCDPAMDPDKGEVMPAQSAGGHLDPRHTGVHNGPMGDGHLGDLPALKVDSSGKATAPVVAPRLKMTDLAGHALMIHAGGDNYSDKPEKLGGGGKRIACGVIGS